MVYFPGFENVDDIVLVVVFYHVNFNCFDLSEHGNFENIPSNKKTTSFSSY